MADGGNFDRLVSGISLDERQKILEKLKGQSTLSSDLLYFDDEGAAPAAHIEIEYAKLPWFYRLWYIILSFFRANSPIKIFADTRIAALGNKIEEKFPGLYDYQKRLLLPAFCRQMENLKEAARFFYTALDTSVNRDKGAFFAFLGSLEMPDIHKRLHEETEPEFIVEKFPGIPETELRQTALRLTEETLTILQSSVLQIMLHQRTTLYL